MKRFMWVVSMADELRRLGFIFTAESVRAVAEENGIVLPPPIETSGHQYIPDETLSESDRVLALELADEFERNGIDFAARWVRMEAKERTREPDHVLWARQARLAAGLGP